MRTNSNSQFNIYERPGIHVDELNAVKKIARSLYLSEISLQTKQSIIVCIGTDRLTGDSLGPLVGTYLTSLKHFPVKVYGTLKHPVHAVNLREVIKMIENDHRNAEVLVVDACLGREDQIGNILVNKGSIKPGAALRKDLPAIGNAHIKGVVNASGSFEFMTLQSTRLYEVMKMSEVIGKGVASYFS